jgi:hypothetical protein
MSLGRTNFDEVSEADLSDLIQAQTPEGLTIDYKRDAYGPGDAENKEALKDISSFANSAGGHLIIGMDEADGLPTAPTGLPGVDPDALINRLEAVVRDGVEPRIVGIRMRQIRLAAGGVAIVVRIPRSWNPPHRVSSGNRNRFYVRNSGGAHEASVEELRVLFTQGADTHERIRNFRLERLRKLNDGNGPVALQGDGRLVVHMVPLSAFGQSAPVDPERAHQLRERLNPIASIGIPGFNLDGFINVRGGAVPHGYTQVFRNGSIEATRSNILRGWNNLDAVPAGVTTNDIVGVLPNYFSALQGLDVPAPIVLMASYQGVTGARLGVAGFDAGEINPFPRGDLLLPEVIIDDYKAPGEYVSALRPIFDALWNAAGLPRCTYYDVNGAWNPPR